MSKFTAKKKLYLKARCLHLISQYFPYDNISKLLIQEFSITKSYSHRTIAAVKKDLQIQYDENVDDKRNRMIASLENDLREAQAMYKEKKTTAWFSMILTVKDKLASYEQNELKPELAESEQQINITFNKI